MSKQEYIARIAKPPEFAEARKLMVHVFGFRLSIADEKNK
jgi:hypothetical protein